MVASVDQNLQPISRPVPLPVILENIPETLKKLRRWVVWRYEYRGTRWTKVLYDPHRIYEMVEHKGASSTNPQTWGSFEQVAAIYRDSRVGMDGIGFVLTAPDGIVGIDLDHSKGTRLEENFLMIPTYAERSPSGKGLRMIGLGKLPKNKGLKRHEIEIYSTGRYLTLTGHIIPGHANEVIEIQRQTDIIVERLAPPPAVDETDNPDERPTLDLGDEEILDLARAHDRSGRFAALFDCDEKILEKKADGSVDMSRAHAALCVKLAFYTRDPDQIARLVGASALGEYYKWQGEKYRERTISFALNAQNEMYRPAGEGFSDHEVASVVGTWPEMTVTVTVSVTEATSDLLTWDQLKKKAAEQQDRWIVKDILEPGTSTVLSGLPFSGKTTVLASLMGCIATERPFLGNDISARCPLLFLNCDRLRERHIVKRISRAFTDSFEEHRFGELFFTVDIPAIPATITPSYLDDLMARVEKMTSQIGSDTGLVIIDPLRAAFLQAADPGAENDASAMTAVLAPLRALARTSNWSIVVPHHNAKGSNRYSGSAAIAGNSDSVWNLTREEGSTSATLHMTTRDGEKTLRYDERPDGLHLTDVPEAHVDRMAEFLRNIPASPETAKTMTQMCERLAMSRSECQRQLASAGDQIEIIGTGKKGDPLRYHLAMVPK
ncbi:phage NrS-1 polymerase family protein [Zavarzinella formosa]|uniref:phage NrS-1 polymerase family protein n=1 Tax=Zavarzinella formosa TaxID=360055 RepID=UPI000362F1D6|nr:AAA family ATPase [Zavarzinella formosa]